MAAASPAGPAPTITTSNSIASRAGRSLSLMRESPPGRFLGAFPRFQRGDNCRRPPGSVGRTGRGREKLLAVYAVTADCGAALFRNKPVDESIPGRLVDVRVVGPVDQDDFIRIEKLRVAIDHDDLVRGATAQPGAAVGQRIGVEPNRHLIGQSHSQPGFAIPVSGARFRIDRGGLPEALL